MITHIININDKNIKFHLNQKYFIDLNQFPQQVVEFRNINSDQLKLLKETFNIFSNNSFFLHTLNDGNFDVLLLADSKTIYNYLSEQKHLLNKLTLKVFEQISYYCNSNYKKYHIGKKIFDFNKVYLMGILNVTPDSFSDGGKYLKTEDAIYHGLNMIETGVDIIDIGGESSRPGSDFISEDEEIKRIIPVIEELLKRNSELVISVDTTKSKVAEIALDLGVSIINDISALSLDKNMINVVSKKNATVILMHMQGIPKTMQNNPTYKEIVTDIIDYLDQRSKMALTYSINNILIDPGIGFGKSLENNFTIIKRLKEFSILGYPIVIGLSRKSFIGKTLNLDVNQRDFPSAVLEVISILNSARVIRTHNVKNGKIIVELLNKFL